APELARGLDPGEITSATMRIESRRERAQIPAQSLVWADAGRGDDGGVFPAAREEVLGRAAEPAQHEQRVLTGAVAAPRHAGQSRRADRMIVPPGIELRGHLPDLGGDL